MEMMVVLLIMSIIAAATAPIVSKKMMQSSKSNASPWVFTGQGKNIAYNMGGLDNATAIIGAAKVPEGTNARLYIDCGNNASQIALGSGDTAANILADPVGKRVGIFSAGSNINVPNDSIAIGMNQTLGNVGAVAIGSNAQTSTYGSGIGYNAKASGEYATAVGSSAKAASTYSTAIGNEAETSGEFSLASGARAEASKGSVAIGSKSKATASQSIAIGGGTPTQSGAEASGTYSIAIGTYNSTYGQTKAASNTSIAIGAGTQATDNGTVAVGANAKATGYCSIAQGLGAQSSAYYSTAIGWSSKATKNSSLAVGNGARAEHTNSSAIGTGAYTTADNQIVLGNQNTTVYIPGYLAVGKNTYLGCSGNYVTWVRHKTKGRENWHTRSIEVNSGGNDDFRWGAGLNSGNVWPVPGFISDKRLKNVGDKYIAGINELKKLDFFHFTFKKDEAKTPHVGVIAQDLQKVFPDAVTKGEDGYLRIRFEDMFYAVINAIKELDNRINSIIAKNDEQDKTIESQQAKIDKLQETIDAQQKTIEELLKQNEEIISRLKKSE